MAKSICFATCAVCLLLPLLGCGSSINTQPVTGKVTDGGTPLEGVGVSLVPVGSEGPAVRGVTDATGAFAVATVGGQEGAPEGEYKVILLPAPTGTDYMDVGAGVPKETKYPEKYTDPAKAETVTVTSGENVIDIDISK